MKEYEFTAKIFDWRDDGKVQTLVIHCHEDDGSRVVIKCGGHQKRLLEKALMDSQLEET